jgi:hypothetical protein
MHLLNAHLEELFRILSDYDSFFLNSQQSSSLCTTRAYAQCPLGRDSTELLRASVCNCVFSHTAFPPRCSTTLRSSSRVVDSSSCAAARLCLNPQCSEMHPLCTAIRTRSVLSHPPGVKPQRPSPEIKTTCKFLAYIHSI